MAKRIWKFGRVAMLAGLCASAAQAQQQGGNDSNILNLPENIQMLGDSNPNVRRATAVVNGAVLTGTDVEQRLALILAANEQQISPEEQQRLRRQVLRNLIDETLQIQEANALEMEVTDAEVDQTYNRLATQRFNRTIDEMKTYLTSIGSSPASLKRQIKGELSWNRLLQRNVQPFVNVSTEEVRDLYDRLEASRGTAEYRLGEIYLAATPANRAQVQANAKQIVEQLQKGGSFVGYARQYSEASTAAVGGDLGWIRLAQLQNSTLENVAREMSPGQLVGPIEIPGGYSILYMIDKRQVGMADPRDALLSLKQISMDFPAGTSQAKAKQQVDMFTKAVQKMKGCGTADAEAAKIGATVVNNDQIAVRSLPEALQAPLLELSVGQATPPFGSLEEGIRVLMLCGRDDPAVEAGPNYDQLMAQIEDERVNKRAQRYLRDLRRDAVIEYN
nr:peptidylprolyl isomerase [Altericroceibacterium endophyticum]